MKTCNICNKGSILVGGYSNKVRATKYNPIQKLRKKPNLQKATLLSGEKVIICTNCLKKNRHLA